MEEQEEKCFNLDDGANRLRLEGCLIEKFVLLGRTWCAACVAEGEDVVWVRELIFVDRFLSGFKHFFVEQKLDVFGLRTRFLLFSDRVEGNEDLQLAQVFRVQQGVQRLFLAEARFYPRVVQHVADRRRSQSVIDRNQGVSVESICNINDHPFVPILGEDADQWKPKPCKVGRLEVLSVRKNGWCNYFFCFSLISCEMDASTKKNTIARKWLPQNHAGLAAGTAFVSQ